MHILQHHVHIHAAITMRFASTPCRTQMRNRLTSKRSKPHPPHTGGTLHRRLQPLYTEKTHGFVLRFPPQNQPHATFMQAPQGVLQAIPQVSTHMAAEHDNNHAVIARMYCYEMSSVTPQSHTPSLIAFLYLCDVLTPPFSECMVMWCQVSHHNLSPAFVECILKWCSVSHHCLTPLSHTTLHWVHSYVM